MTGRGWETFPHGADMGIRGFGHSREEAMEQVAMALTGVVAEPGSVAPARAIDITCRSEDDELLLLDWLNALVYEMATRQMLFSRFEVEVRDGCLRGRAFGEPIDVERHHPAVEIKGATCTELRLVRQADGTWRAQCVVDV